jgi:hypothetical protein
MCVQVTLLAPILAAKQHELTYYRQRDGIVKSVGRFSSGAGTAPASAVDTECGDIRTLSERCGGLYV